MVDSLINIPGPLFLILFSVYAALIIFLMKLYSLKLPATMEAPPDPSRLNPVELAVLRKGSKGALICSLFNLWRKGMISIKKKDRYVVIERTGKNEPKPEGLEKTIYGFCHQTRYYRHFFTRASQETINNMIEPYKETLYNYGLYRWSIDTFHQWKSVLIGLFLILTPGGTKLYFGIIREKPFAFLIALLILFTIAILAIINPGNEGPTLKGRKYIKDAKKRFSWLFEDKSGDVGINDDTIMYGIALFGISKFIGSKSGALLEHPASLDSGPDYTFFATGCAGCSGGCGGGCSGGCGGCGGD